MSVEYLHADEASFPQPGVTIMRCRDSSWHDLLQRQPNSLDWLPAADVLPNGSNDTTFLGMGPVPVLFWGKGYEHGHQPFVELRNDGSLIFYADIIAATFFMLCRWEEMVLSHRDKHDRFPGVTSTAFRQGFLDRPIIDEYALILREWLKAIFPQWKPQRQTFSVKLSHDIDLVRRYRSSYLALRGLAGAAIKRGNFSGFSTSSLEILLQTTLPRLTTFYRGIRQLADLSERYKIKDSAFYFMTAKPTPQDNDYDFSSPLIQDCINELRHRDMEVGLHPSYDTYDDFNLFSRQKAALDRVLGNVSYGGRQHYLRFRVPQTWRYWERLGFAYDSSMGYADHEGFRCGTCHPFQPFDIEQDRELQVLELPLIAMDVTLYLHRQLTPHQAEESLLKLALRCQKVGGTFTLLWHNSSLHWEWRIWAKMYERTLSRLAHELATGS